MADRKPGGAPSGSGKEPHSALWSRHTWLILAVGLAVTAAVTLQVKSGVDRIDMQELTEQCDEIQDKIIGRLDDHVRLLRSGAAFFNASGKVTREQWRLFSRDQELEQQLPGLQGLGFSLLIPRGELARHVRELRGEGFPEYAVKPAGDRELYSSIIYLEPFSGRNLRAFGYDMFSEPVRRGAMELARDTGAAALSGKVILVQEAGLKVQAGTLMFFPVYRQGAPHGTVAQRRASLLGWVYSPHRMTDLLQGTVGRSGEDAERLIHFQLFDGVEQSPHTLLYETPSVSDSKRTHEVILTRRIKANGRTWTIRFAGADGGFFTASYLGVWITMAGGAAVTLLLFFLIRSLLSTRSQALALARTMTHELHESEEKVCLVLNTIGEGVYGLDLNGCCTFCNPAALRILGLRTQEELLGKNMHRMIHHSSRDGSVCSEEICPICRAFRENSECHMESELFWKADGASFPVEYWSVPQYKEGAIVGAVVTFQDITVRIAAEKKLLRAHEEWRETFDTLPDLVAILGVDHRIIRVNRAMAAAMKVDADGAQGLTCFRHLHGTDCAPADCPHSMVLADGREHSIVLHEERLGGWFQVSATPIHDEEGVLMGSVHVVHDITTLKKNEQELLAGSAALQEQAELLRQEVTEHRSAQLLLETLNGELEERVAEGVRKGRAKDLALIHNEKMVSLGQLAAGVAHEINNPMGYIASNLNVLADYFGQIATYGKGGEENEPGGSVSFSECRGMSREMETILEDGADLIRESLEGAEKVSKIVQELKAFSRNDAPERETVTLTSCLESALTVAGNELKYVATVRKEYESREEVFCHPGQLSQVFLNLLVNAGHAVVSEKMGEIVLRSRHDDNFVYVSVSDTGCGIPEEIRERIFDPFFTTKEVGKGTGLGLSISLDIMKKHGGELTVESVVGSGTTFTVKLPVLLYPME